MKVVEEGVARVAGGVGDDLARLIRSEVRHVIDEEFRVINGKVVLAWPAAIDTGKHGLDDERRVCGRYVDETDGCRNRPPNTNKLKARHGTFPCWFDLTYE